MKRKKPASPGITVVGLRANPQRQFELQLIAKVLPGISTMTGVLEWALDVAVSHTPALTNLSKVWSPIESERFLNTVAYYPQMLDHDQHRLLAFLTRRREFWTFYSTPTSPVEGNYMAITQNFNYALLRDTWDLIKGHVIDGQPWDEPAFSEICAKHDIDTANLSPIPF